MANIFMRFPGGRQKALTLSYDDGVEQDAKLIAIMKKYGLKGTFNINSGLYAAEGTHHPAESVRRRMTRKQCQDVYLNSGMEVAIHGLTHSFLEQLPKDVCTYEIVQDRINLEKEYNTIVRGMAYPFGTYPLGSASERMIEILRQCGIVYSRTTASTEKFTLPTDWFRLSPTCHHGNPRLMELAHNFVENCGSKKPELYKAPGLFYLWGHSYEFEQSDNWNIIEEFAEYMGCCDDIWHATNIEIYNYVNAYEQLVFSMDGKQVFNPTYQTLYFEQNTIINPKPVYDDSHIYCVKPGEIVRIIGGI